MLLLTLPQTPLPADGVAFVQKVDGKETSGRFLLTLPEGYDADRKRRWPLVMFLHGVGERGDDLDRVRAHGIPKEVAKGRKFPFILVSPQCPADRLWDTTMLRGLLDYAERTYRVDRKRETVTGLSMGGYGAWALAMVQPRRFAAIAPLCGGPRTEDAWPLRGAKIGVVDIPLDEAKRRLKGLPVFTVHGDADAAVPVQGTRDLVAALRSVGDEVRYTEVPGGGHDIWTPVYAGEEVYAFLLGHRR
jgi:predicted peptidase